VTAVVSTLGKAFGLAGAFVAAPKVVIDFLVNRCRPFVFSTAISPLLLHAVDLVLDRIAVEPERRARALTLADRLRRKLRARAFDWLQSEGPIVPVILGDSRRAVAVAEALQARGFDVRAIRPPTVSPSTARLRISVHADRTEAEIDALAEALWETAK
jgi:8-amino-7-oxononanoate synthase